EYLVSEADRPLFRTLVARLFSPLFAELGWEPKLQEPDETRLLRAQIAWVLGYTARLPPLLAEAEARLQKYLREPGSLDGTLADQVVRLGALSGNAARWDDYLSRTHAATPETALRFRYALASFEDPALIARTLRLTLGDQIPPEDILP